MSNSNVHLRALEVIARHGAIYFEHQGESFTYSVEHQYHSQKFICHFDALHPESVILTDPKTGRHMGEWARAIPVSVAQEKSEHHSRSIFSDRILNAG